MTRITSCTSSKKKSNQMTTEELKSNSSKRIDNLVEIFKGNEITRIRRWRDKHTDENKFLVLERKQSISNGKLKLNGRERLVMRPSEGFTSHIENQILKYGDILLHISLRGFDFYVHIDKNKNIIAGEEFFILRGEETKYVSSYLFSEIGKKLFSQQIKKYDDIVFYDDPSAEFPIDILKSIEIPILHIKDLDPDLEFRELSLKELIAKKEEYDIKMKLYGDAKDFHNKTFELLLKNQKDILNTIDRVENKVDNINTILIELASDFDSIKKLPVEIDEKINKLNLSLDKKIVKLSLNEKQLETHISEIKEWFDFYDLLESKSKKYLPEAEYIFDHISKLENPDYSPFILQYCRALENELLNKIFRAYVQSLIDRKIEITKEFEWDFGRKESGKPNSENTLKLVKHIQRCLKKSDEQWFFELGSMQVNLRYLIGKTAEKSPLLIDLKSFLLNRFEKEILNIEYLDEIKTIVIDYRNQSAHPNLIDREKVVKFKMEMKDCLIVLMENYKK